MKRLFTIIAIGIACLVSADMYAQWPIEMYDRYDYTNYTNYAPFNQRITTTGYDADLLEAAIFYETNRQRALHGRPQFRYDYRLEVSAHNHSVDMVNYDFFSHESPVSGKRTMSDRYAEVGIPSCMSGENIALRSIGSSYAETAEQLVDQWMNSPGHRANILNEGYTHLGCGVAFYKNYSSVYIKATQNFMRGDEFSTTSSTRTVEEKPKANTASVGAADVQPTQDELELYELIMQYRAEKGLPRIPLSASLTYVAQTHAKDMYTYFDEIPEGCNPHSWSGHGPWTKCDYYPDHRNAACMWSKPRELTPYQGNGFEISTYYTPPTSGIMSSKDALNSWKGSSAHNAVIVNQGIWYDNNWQAIGVGMYKGYACVWFGMEKDPVEFRK